jgi:hypothetical protein
LVFTPNTDENKLKYLPIHDDAYTGEDIIVCMYDPSLLDEILIILEYLSEKRPKQKNETIQTYIKHLIEMMDVEDKKRFGLDFHRPKTMHHPSNILFNLYDQMAKKFQNASEKKIRK